VAHSHKRISTAVVAVENAFNDFQIRKLVKYEKIKSSGMGKDHKISSKTGGEGNTIIEQVRQQHPDRM